MLFFVVSANSGAINGTACNPSDIYGTAASALPANLPQSVGDCAPNAKDLF